MQFRPDDCNRYSQIDFRAKLWICPFCLQRNQLPPQYANITPNELPLELLQEYLTIEYILNKPLGPPPIFLYVVDTCLEEEDLKALKDALIVSLNLLPQHALVGIVTYGTMAQVHEIGFTECPKSYVFRGNKEYSGKQVAEMLGLDGSSARPAPARPGQPQQQPQMSGITRFLQPVGQAEFTMTTLFEQLQRDSWPVANDRRPLRCTGTALGVAVGLIEVHSDMAQKY